MDATKPISIFYSLYEPVSHLVDPAGLDVVVPYLGFKRRQPGQDLRLLVNQCAVIPHIVNRIISIKTVDIVIDVGFRHYKFFAILRVVKDGFLCNFTG